MPRPEGGGPGGRRQLRSVVRGACFSAAAVLGVVAIWLVVTGTTQKSTTVGALLGFWAVLMAAFPVFGSRQPTARDLAEPLDARPATGLERMSDAADRREYEYRLQQMLRLEIQAALGPELTSLRTDIAALRSELVEKVGGQLRLERIETTRVIGSDIEALQHEVRQLKDGRQLGSFSVGTTTSYVQSLDERRVAAPAPTWEAEVVDEVVDEVVHEPPPSVPAAAPQAPHATPQPPAAAQTIVIPPVVAAEPVLAEPFVPGAFVPQQLVTEPAAPTPPAAMLPAREPSAEREPPAREPAADRMPTAERVPAAEPARSADPFADLPRLRPFTEFELDPIEDTPEPENHAGRGRRDSLDQAPNPSSGRHAGSDEPIRPTRAGGGRRRHEAADDGDDVLARILAREGTGRG
jgi:hypothetical protein